MNSISSITIFSKMLFVFHEELYIDTLEVKFFAFEILGLFF